MVQHRENIWSYYVMYYNFLYISCEITFLNFKMNPNQACVLLDSHQRHVFNSDEHF